MHRIVYLPLEIRSRELASKAMLATELAVRGVPVVIGQQWMLAANFDRMPPGVMLFKGTNQIHRGWMKEARQAGHRVLVQDEELLGIIDESALHNALHEELRTVVHGYLAHGEFERSLVEKHAGGNFATWATGNGRIDVLKPAFGVLYADEVELIRQRHGEFILINTNLGIIHNVFGDLERVKEIFTKSGAYVAADPESRRRFDERVEWERANFVALTSLIQDLLDRRPTLKVIVRPHPAENLGAWTDWVGSNSRIRIIREGAHVPWTLAARMLLHTSCTTGLEAQVAMQYALSYVPTTSWLNRLFISNHVNPTVSDHDSALQAIERFLDRGERLRNAGVAGVEKFLSNLGEDYAFRRIADLIVDLLPTGGDPVRLPQLLSVDRPIRLREKFTLDGNELVVLVSKLAKAAGLSADFQLQGLGDSLFLLSTRIAAGSRSDAGSRDAVVAAVTEAFQSRNWREVTEQFRRAFGEAHRHPRLCLFAGIAFGNLGQHDLALQYLRQASLAPCVDPEVAFALSQAHRYLGDTSKALYFAKLAYDLLPTSIPYFRQFADLIYASGGARPQHWVVIGDSHARYLRYMQANRGCFFGDAVFLECWEYGGATAFGLANLESKSGVLRDKDRWSLNLGSADRVLVQFGEVDCRRAAWKFAAESGCDIRDALAEAARHLERFVQASIVPHNRRIVMLGAKPQIIQDADFHRNAQDDERIVFKPLTERQAATDHFNALQREMAARFDVDYVDVDHALRDEKSRGEFYRNAFWHDYSTDTHGNLDYFAQLHFESLRGFAPEGGAGNR